MRKLRLGDSDQNPSSLTHNPVLWQLDKCSGQVSKLREKGNSSTYIAATFHESAEVIKYDPERGYRQGTVLGAGRG